MDYSYHILSAAALVYAVFAFFSVRAGRWYFLVFHPFAIFCFCILWRYRLASDIPSIAMTVDRSVAVGVLLASAVFWLAYFALKKEYIDEFFGKLLGKPSEQADTGYAATPRKFWFLYSIVFVVVVGIFFTDYLFYKGKFFFMFFRLYKWQYHEHVIRTGQIWNPAWLGVVRWFLNFFGTSVMFVSLPLLFETLRVKKRVKGLLPMLAAIVLVLMSLTLLCLTGFRSYPASFGIAVFVLILISFHYPGHRLSKAAIPVLGVILCYAGFWVLFVQEFRTMTIDETLGERASKVISKTGFQNIVDRTLSRQKKVEVPDLPVLAIEKPGEKKTEEIVIDQTQTAQMNTGQVQAVTDAVHDNETEKKLEDEMRFLKSYPISVSITREIGWDMMYFGRHKDFLGLFYNFKRAPYILLPSRFRPEGGIALVGNVIWRERAPFPKTPISTVAGPFGEGYASYGYVGAYLYWSFLALTTGLFSKFAIVSLFRPDTRLELVPPAIFLITWIHHHLWQGFSIILLPMTGFILILSFCAIMYRLFPSPADSPAKESEKVMEGDL